MDPLILKIIAGITGGIGVLVAVIMFRRVIRLPRPADDPPVFELNPDYHRREPG